MSEGGFSISTEIGQSPLEKQSFLWYNKNGKVCSFGRRKSAEKTDGGAVMNETMRLPEDYDSLNNFCASVLGMYAFAVEISLTDGALKTVAGDAEICRSVDRLKSCGNLIRRLNERYIHESYHSFTEVFLDIRSIRERLWDKDFTAMDFLGADQKWYLANLVPVLRKENGDFDSVYLLIRKSGRRRSEDLAVFSSVAQSYDGIYLCNAVNGTYRTYKKSDRGVWEQAPEMGSYGELIRRTAERIESEQERRALIDFADADRICGELREKDSLGTVYKIGESRFRLSFTAAEHDRLGSVMHFSAAVRDVTEELREEERKSAELNSRLEAILSGITGGFRICRNDEGFGFVYVSEGVAEIQGYTVDELLRVSGGTLEGSVYPADAPGIVSEIVRQYKQGDTYLVRYRVVHKDGSLRWVSDTGKRVAAKDGSILHYSLIQDITATKRSVDAIHDLFAMQRQLVEAIGSGLICYTFPEKELILSNDEACRILGCDMGDDPIESLSYFLNHRVIAENRSMSSSAVQPEHPEDFRLCEYRVRGDNGEIWRIKYYSRLLKLENGQMIAMVNLTDLTEQARIASMLNRERVQYRDALTTNCEYTFRLNLTEGIVSADNESCAPDRFAEGLGIEFPCAYDHMMELWQKRWQPQLLTPHAGDFLNCGGLLALYERGNTILEMECYIPRQEKYYRWIILVSTEEGSGHKTAIVIIHDFTELHREAEEKRAELEELYESREEKLAIIGALGNIYYCIYYVDLSLGTFSIVSGNDYFSRYSEGDSDAARTAVHWTECGINEEFRAEMLEFIDLSTLSERMRNVPILSRECVSKSLGWIRVSFIAANRDHAGNVTQVLWTVQHIDQEKQRELDAKIALQEAYDAANRANTAKTDFLASMSHNIRTPMNAVIGMTAIAGAHLNDPERIADCLSKINLSSHRLLGLINEILDMNKIESGKLDFNVEECNLSELVHHLLAAARPRIDKKRHAFSVNMNRLVHDNVIGDSRRIQQMLMNLLDNAVKYTPSGGEIRLTITEWTTHREKVGCYEFVLEDNGIGMSEEYLPHLYEPFTRAKDPRVEKIHGTGLGMAIARNIAQMMNGDIKTESVPGKGTKVTATIFLELRDRDSGFRPEMLRGFSVLIADDDKIVCESTCVLLEQWGMHGEWVQSGEEAIKRVYERHEAGKDYFAVLLDWQMPGTDGISAAKEVRRIVGDGMPIILISSYDWSDIEREAGAAGVNAFLNKPILQSRMIHLFREFWDRSAQIRGMSLDGLKRESFSGVRALLAEDNELNAEIAKEILGMLGLDVEYVRNGREALERFSISETGEYDIVFMDIQMPEMDGYEATRAIRALPGDYAKTVPILAMSANAFAEDVRSAKEAGMNEHIAKPLDFDRLQKVLNRWLK